MVLCPRAMCVGGEKSAGMMRLMLYSHRGKSGKAIPGPAEFVL